MFHPTSSCRAVHVTCTQSHLTFVWPFCSLCVCFGCVWCRPMFAQLDYDDDRTRLKWSSARVRQTGTVFVFRHSMQTQAFHSINSFQHCGQAFDLIVFNQITQVLSLFIVNQLLLNEMKNFYVQRKRESCPNRLCFKRWVTFTWKTRISRSSIFYCEMDKENVHLMQRADVFQQMNVFCHNPLRTHLSTCLSPHFNDHQNRMRISLNPA